MKETLAATLAESCKSINSRARSTHICSTRFVYYIDRFGQRIVFDLIKAVFCTVITTPDNKRVLSVTVVITCRDGKIIHCIVKLVVIVVFIGGFSHPAGFSEQEKLSRVGTSLLDATNVENNIILFDVVVFVSDTDRRNVVFTSSFGIARSVGLTAARGIKCDHLDIIELCCRINGNNRS